MPRTKEVRITKGDDEAFVHPSSVAAYVRNGWTGPDDGSSSEESQQAPAKTTTTRKAD